MGTSKTSVSGRLGVKRPGGQPCGQQEWAKLGLKIVNRNWLTKLHWKTQSENTRHQRCKGSCEMIARWLQINSQSDLSLAAAAAQTLAQLQFSSFSSSPFFNSFCSLTRSSTSKHCSCTTAVCRQTHTHTLLYSALCSSMHRSIPLIANDVIEVCRCHWISLSLFLQFINRMYSPRTEGNSRGGGGGRTASLFPLTLRSCTSVFYPCWSH